MTSATDDSDRSRRGLRLADLLDSEGTRRVLAPLLLARDLWIYLLDLDDGGRLLDANRAGGSATGCPPDALRQRTIAELLVPTDGRGFAGLLGAQPPPGPVQLEAALQVAGDQAVAVRATVWAVPLGDRRLGLALVQRCPDRARLDAERQRLVERVRTVREIDLRIRHEPDLGRLLDRVCAMVVQEHGFESAWVALNAAVSGEIAAASAGAAPPAARLRAWLRACDSPDCLAQATASEGPLGRVGTAAGFGPGCPCAESHAGQQVLVVRIVYRNELLGLLTAASREPRARPEEDLVLLAQLADALAHALHAIRVSGLQRDSRDAIGALADAAPAVLFSLRAGRAATPWVLEFVGDGARSLLGVEPREAVAAPLNIWDRFHSDDRPRLLQALQDAVVRGASVAELRFEHAEQGQRVLQGHLRVSEEGPARLIGSVLDVTPLRSAEAEVRTLGARLARAEKLEAVGQLAGGIAHDFNNLLTTITSYARFLERSLEPSDRRREDAARILRAADQAAVLTRKLLAVGRQEPREPVAVKLGGVVTRTAELLERTLGADVRLELDLSRACGPVFADPGDLDQVLLNLALNARDAMPLGGRIRISLAEEDDQAHLAVRDDGIGMDEATVGRIFEPFFTTRGDAGGTGLGLATCYGIVDSLGGRFEVDSTPGEGTTFHVFLPLFLGDSPLTSRSMDATPVVGFGRILVVEDEPAVREAAVRALEEAGFEVVQAADLPQALEALASGAQELTLVLSDIVLPSGRGFEVERLAAELRPELPVLLMSGYARELVFGEGRQPGQRAVLQKPFTPEKLVQAVLAALPEHAPWSVPAGGRRILLVEDDPSVRDAVQRILELSGREVVALGSVEEARADVNEDQPFAAVISDLDLPDGSGLRLLDWLLATRPSMRGRTLLMTGSPRYARRPPTLGGQVLDVLAKPLDEADLLRWLDRVTT